MANVALGFAKLEDYLTKSPYFGNITGRYANRIAKGAFTLGGRPTSSPPTTDRTRCTAASSGFDKMVWQAKEVSGPDSVGFS